MKLSILITFYNQEKYVDRALSGVLSQKVNFDFEILIGDDGSDDGTIEKIKVWQEKYPDKIKLYIMDRDKDRQYEAIFRVSASRINLVKRAKGEYLILLDGDDFYIDDTKLQTQVDILDNPKNQDCVACAHNVNYFYENTSKSKPMLDVSRKEKKYTPEFYWAFSYFHPVSLMFRNVFKEEFPTEAFKNKFFDDNLITFYVLKFGSIYYIPKIMANYNQNENRTWLNRTEDEQYLLNIMCFDLELRVWRKYQKSSLVRHYGIYKSLYKNINNISDALIEKYLSHATEENFKNALDFLTYKKAPLFHKIKFRVNFHKYKYEQFLYKMLISKVQFAQR